MSTIINADKIVVLSRGEIVESGTHSELLRMDQVYARLVQSQLAQGDDYIKKSLLEKRKSSDLDLKKMPSSEFRKSDMKIPDDKEEPFLEKKISKEDEKVKQEEEEKIQKEKEQEESKFFSESSGKMMSLLSDAKMTVLLGVIFSAINGGIWPIYGWLIANGVEKLALEDKDLVKSESRKIALYFLYLAAGAAIAAFFQR